MSGYGGIQGTPWHVGRWHREEDEPRRHKSRCRHYRKDRSCAINTTCHGSAHCLQYRALSEEEFFERQRTRADNGSAVSPGGETNAVKVKKLSRAESRNAARAKEPVIACDDLVQHPKWGVGRIVSIYNGHNDVPYIRVLFKDGVKTFLRDGSIGTYLFPVKKGR